MPWLGPVLALTVVATLAAIAYLRPLRKSRQVDARRLAEWGRPKGRDPDPALVGVYHAARVSKRGGAGALDARTWDDLDLDAVFAFLDRTESVPGRQVLYDRLRSTTHSPESLAAFDDLAERFRDGPFRLRTQRWLEPLNAQSVYWLWSLALEPIERLPRWAAVYPIFAVLMLVSICLIPAFHPLAVVSALGLIVGILLRARFGFRLVPIANSFRDMVRLLNAADRFADAPELAEELRGELKARLAALARVRQFGGWLGRDTGGADLVGLFIEYLNLLFCLDANAVMLAVAEMRRRQGDLHAVFETVGSLDAALAVASVRASGLAWTRPIFAPPVAAAIFDDVRHPLVDECVPNSITLGSPAGVLVTGANMTGKSTFLRTIGVNAVLAQTIHTVFASRYEAPWLSVHSCITPADDLQAGKSYYQAEVETLVAMLRAAGSENVRLSLFDELFRGTNTLDRIGAASAVLEYLVRGSTPSPPPEPADGRTPESAVQSPVSGVPAPEEAARPQIVDGRGGRCFVLAATHDLELVSLLTPDYAVVHFADQLGDNTLQFDYKLRPGPTTTRNAIALLGVLGAPQEVVAEALGRTERLREGRRNPAES